MQRQQVAELQRGKQPFNNFRTDAALVQQTLLTFLLGGNELPHLGALVRLCFELSEPESAKHLEMPGDDKPRQRADALGLAYGACPGAKKLIRRDRDEWDSAPVLEGLRMRFGSRSVEIPPIPRRAGQSPRPCPPSIRENVRRSKPAAMVPDKCAWSGWVTNQHGRESFLCTEAIASKTGIFCPQPIRTLDSRCGESFHLLDIGIDT